MSPSRESDIKSLVEAIKTFMRGHPALTNVRFVLENRYPDSESAGFVLAIDRWTIGLSRLQADHQSLYATEEQVRDRDRHDAVAAELFNPQFLDAQGRRHRAALANGLTTSPDAALPFSAMAIDRAIARLLVRRSIGLRKLRDWQPSFVGDRGDEDSAIVIDAPFKENGLVAFTISLCEDDIVPTLTCGPMPIGSGSPPARLRGNVLEVDMLIPETLIAAFVGRSLGEVVATGIPILDERRIVSATESGNGVEITLNVDLTTIGEAWGVKRWRRWLWR